MGIATSPQVGRGTSPHTPPPWHLVPRARHDLSPTFKTVDRPLLRAVCLGHQHRPLYGPLLVAWLSGRTSVFGRRTFSVLR